MQKTAYEMRMSDWSSDVCSSDLDDRDVDRAETGLCGLEKAVDIFGDRQVDIDAVALPHLVDALQRVVEMLGGAAADEDVDAIACQRSEEGRVGQECVCTCRSRRSQ